MQMSDMSEFNFEFSTSQTVLYNYFRIVLSIYNIYMCFYWTVIFNFQVLPYRNTACLLFVGFYGISTFVGYLTPNPFLWK